jgi:transcriptional regulator with XRE-family HTH domain
MLDKIDTDKNQSRKINPIDIAIGKNLRKLRMSRGVSQEKLGEAMSLTFQQIQKYENGTNRLSMSKALMIAHRLECSMMDFLDGISVADGEVTLADDFYTSARLEIDSLLSKIESRRLRTAIRMLIREGTSDALAKELGS